MSSESAHLMSNNDSACSQKSMYHPRGYVLGSQKGLDTVPLFSIDTGLGSHGNDQLYSGKYAQLENDRRKVGEDGVSASWQPSD